MDFDLKCTLEILRQTPATLKSMLGGLSESWLLANRGEPSWCPRDVVAHLIHGEREDWIARTRIILQHGDAETFTPFDPSKFAKETGGKTTAELLDIFAELRIKNLAALEALNLQPEQFELTGTHPEFGRITLSQLLATWAVHDINHIVQIGRTLAYQYDDAVGPWKAYLSVLTR